MKAYEYLVMVVHSEYDPPVESEEVGLPRYIRCTLEEAGKRIVTYGQEGWLLCTQYKLAEQKREMVFSREIEPAKPKASGVEI